MPTSTVKNNLYRLALPFLSPSVSGDPIAAIHGGPLLDRNGFRNILRRNHITGGAFCLHNGSRSCNVFTRSFHTEKVADTATYFRVASITKMATSLLAGILMDKGLLDPDKPVSDFFTVQSGFHELDGISVMHLLSHTSGLSDPPGLEFLLENHTPLNRVLPGRRIAEPGRRFLYSNLGFGLLGSIFESLLNKPIHEIYARFLFEPLRLDATIDGSSLNEDRIMPVVRILSYNRSQKVTVPPLGREPICCADPIHHFGYSAGSMYITLPSMTELLKCIRDGGSPLLSPKYAGFMQLRKAEYGKLSPSLSYGSGLLIIRDKRISEGPVYGHQGFAYGCVDGAFWEDSTGNMLISLNGGCSEARTGRLGIANFELMRYAFRREFPLWRSSEVQK